MKQKFENLGLILSRDAQKNLIGGSMNEESLGDVTTCYECSAGAKEWGFGCPSPLREDCKCNKNC
jgi:hypothetical protein